MKRMLILGVALIALSPLRAKEPSTHRAVIADPVINAANPASMASFVLPAPDGAMNAVMYLAAGRGPHPTLLLLHGFPGNEQNLDLAQAARRGGWNVLTLHYRGSWGSPGVFSFGHAAEDARTALAFLRSADAVSRFHIDPRYIVVAGHSMGGFMAADAAAEDPQVVGLFLIDAWNPSATVDVLKSPQEEAAWREEVAGDLPPLHGATYDSLTNEIRGAQERFDLGRRVLAYGNRPLMLVGAERGIGAMSRTVAGEAQSAGANAELTVWSTDHSFSDRRVALADALMRWLDRIAPPLP